MNQLQKILSFVQARYHDTSPEGVTINEVAQEFGMWRNDASQLLNKLVQDEKLVTNGTRPIRYLPVDSACAPAESSKASSDETVYYPFKNIIGSEGSLKLQTSLAKTAASYPPNGMHILILGETGVGKSLMAEEIWRYRCALYPDKHIPFVSFNCSEYSENPQLLLSHLFGHTKGSFTGAVSSRTGLVEQANNGVLLLDEIHHLPPTGQEMLFSIFDKGTFRRLGSDTVSHVNIMIICATTENPESVILKTFQRRIPVHISIPSLKERPLDEKLDLIIYILKQEAIQLNLPIQVSASVLARMLSYKGSANIGDLKNELQLCCARGYMEHLSSPSKSASGILCISTSHLSRAMGLADTSDNIVKPFLDSVLKKTHNRLLIPVGTAAEAIPFSYSGSFNFYNFIEEKRAMYEGLDKTASEIEHDIIHDLYTYYNNQYFQKQYSLSSPEYNRLYGTISPYINELTNQLLHQAFSRKNWTYSQNVVYSIASFLQQTIALSKGNRTLLVSNNNSLLLQYPEENQFLSDIKDLLVNSSNTELSSAELNLLAFLLSQRAHTKENPIGVLIIAHGNSTAASLAQFANETLEVSYVSGIDISSFTNSKQIIDTICHTVTKAPEQRDYILLADMGLFLELEDIILEKTGCHCHVIPSINTALVLETVKAASIPGISLDKAVGMILNNYVPYINVCFEKLSESLPDHYHGTTPSASQDNIVVTFCVTGHGSAKTIAELLSKHATLSKMATFVPMGMMSENVKNMLKAYGSRLKLIIGFIDPQIPNIPFISMDNVLTSKGIERIALILGGITSNAQNVLAANEENGFEFLESHVKYFAPSLDEISVSEQAWYIINEIRHLYGNIAKDYTIRLFGHFASMFERLLNNEIVPLSENAQIFINNNQLIYHQIKPVLTTACSNLKLSITDSEIYYVMALLPPFQKILTQ